MHIEPFNNKDNLISHHSSVPAVSLIGFLPPAELIRSPSGKPSQKLWLEFQGLKSFLAAKLLVL